MKRDKAIETIKELPKEFELEVLLEKLILLEKIEKGLVQLENGKAISHQKVKNVTRRSSRK